MRYLRSRRLVGQFLIQNLTHRQGDDGLAALAEGGVAAGPTNLAVLLDPNPGLSVLNSLHTLGFLLGRACQSPRLGRIEAAHRYHHVLLSKHHALLLGVFRLREARGESAHFVVHPIAKIV